MVVLRLARLLEPSLAPAEVAAGVLEAARLVLGDVPAWLLLGQNGELRLVASADLPPESARRLAHVPLDAPAVETEAVHQQRRLCFRADELGPALAWSRALVEEAKLPGVVALPLVPSERRAVLAFGRATDLDPSEEEVMGALCGFFVRAVESVHLPHETSPRSEMERIRDEIVRCRRVEADLRDSEERFRLVLEEAPIGMSLVSLTGRYQRVNRELCAILGYEESELLQRRWQDITHPDDLETDLDLVSRLVAGRIARYELEKRYLRKDGTEVLVLLGVSLVRDARGAPWYFISRVQDITEQRRLEKALREREAKFRGLFDAALDPIIILDDEARFVDTNAAACQLLGRRREDLVGHRLEALRSRFVDFDLRQAWGELREQGSRTGDLRIRDGGGDLRVLEFSARANFAPSLHLAILRDVTERTRTEEALRRREQQLAEAQAIAHVGHWELDLAADRVYASAEAFRIYGWSAEQGFVTREQLIEAIHPDDLEATRAALWAAVEVEGSFSVDHRILCRDGAVRVVHSRGTATRYPSGVRVLGVVQDITEEREAEREREELVAALAAERTWLDTLIERSPVAILLIDHKGRMRANQRAHDLLGTLPAGTKPEEIDVRFCGAEGDPIAPDGMPLVRAMNGEVLQAEEICIAQEDGRILATLVSAAPIRDEAGDYLGAVAVFEDITRLKDLERLREEWTSVVAHDLRQPVTSINAQAQLLARRAAKTAPELTAKLEHILASARQLNRMIGDLLDVSRIEARRLTLDRQPVELESFAIAVAERMAEELAGHEVQVRADGDVQMAWADPVRLEQVFANLLSNAAKYGAAGAPIEVAIAQEGREVAVRVINQGKGIPAEEMPQLFARFYRARSVREGPVAGLGLGLYITRGLVEAHGGRIRATSEPGRTTTFCFTLPVP